MAIPASASPAAPMYTPGEQAVPTSSLPTGSLRQPWSGRYRSGYAGSMPGHPHSSASERLDPFVSGSRVRELVEQLPVVVYVDTDDQRPSTTYISPNVEQLLGFPP